MAEHDCCGNGTNGLIKGVLIGGLVGVLAGILYAPKSGKEIRDDLRCSTEDLLEKTKGQYERLLERIEKLTGHGKETSVEKEIG